VIPKTGVPSGGMFADHNGSRLTKATLEPKEMRPMEIQEALKIMRALANGVNPQTGEALAGC
jgi:hypothetical protein